MTKKIIYYINQFFGGIGGEEVADTPLFIKEGPLGPALGFGKGWGEDCLISHTIVCGDNYFNENKEKTLHDIFCLVEAENPDLFVAGPAFNAGRYGYACASVCLAVKEKFGIPVLTGMYPENPGATMFKKEMLMVETSNNATGMRTAIPKMTKLGRKLAYNESILSAREEGYIPRGYRLNEIVSEPGAVRAVAMLKKKLAGLPFQTEVIVEEYEQIEPAKPIKDLSKATIAFVTEAGIVPMGNPDHIKHANANNWAKYSLAGVYDLKEGDYEGVHGGFDAKWCNSDPDRIMPVDALRYFEENGYIGKFHEVFYTTVGNGTPIDTCKAIRLGHCQRIIGGKSGRRARPLLLSNRNALRCNARFGNGKGRYTRCMYYGNEFYCRSRRRRTYSNRRQDSLYVQ